MNILHVSAVKNWGGGENHIEALCLESQLAFPEVNHQILCVRNGKFHQKIQEKKIKFFTAPLALKFDLRFSRKIISLCRSEKIDLLHLHDPTALTLTILADKMGKLPPMVFSKKTSFPIKDRKQTLYKYNYPKIRKIFCVSEETKKIAALKIRDKEKLVTIYHGVNLQSQNCSPAFDLREKLKIGPEKILIGNIGNHIRAKNLETFIETVHELVNIQKYKNFHFVQLGVFTDRTEALKNKIASYKLEDHISLLGFVPGASNLIPQFDIMLLTSQSEGLPGVIYESFFHKTPVVSTKVGGIPEIIENGVNGLLAEKEDFKTLSQHILHLSESPELMKKFTELSHEKLFKQYTSKIMAEKTLAEYKKIIHD